MVTRQEYLDNYAIQNPALPSDYENFYIMRDRALVDIRKNTQVLKRTKIGRSIWLEILKPIPDEGFMVMLLWNESSGQFITMRLRVWRKLLKQMLRWNFGVNVRRLSWWEKLKL